MQSVNNKKNTIYVSFATQKGGAGKTSTTTLVASLINSLTDHKIAVVDLDPQFSFSNNREREWSNLQGDDFDQSVMAAYVKLRERNKDRYPVFQLDLFPPIVDDDDFKVFFKDKFKLVLDGFVKRGVVGEAVRKSFESGTLSKQVILEVVYKRYLNEVVMEKIMSFKALGEYDIVFFDFPGTTAFAEIASVIKLMDYILVPLYPDTNSIDSSKGFLEAISMAKSSGMASIKDFAVFMWRFSKETNKREFEALADGVSAMGIKLFENKVFDSKEFERNRSTIVPFDLTGIRSLKPFVSEVLSFIGK
jgi:cellulose biosynthesis protein BcsQ